MEIDVIYIKLKIKYIGRNATNVAYNLLGNSKYTERLSFKFKCCRPMYIEAKVSLSHPGFYRFYFYRHCFYTPLSFLITFATNALKPLFFCLTLFFL